jgi:hypothetical protein
MSESVTSALTIIGYNIQYFQQKLYYEVVDGDRGLLIFFMLVELSFIAA